MKLNEKLFYCRKRAGLSQEALADKLGVSRQAVSKWETGEAVPEPAKLYALSRFFGVTADWLLDDAEGIPEENGMRDDDKAPEEETSSSGGARNDWTERLPGLIGKLARRFGWLVGVYIACVGALFTGFGFLMYAIATNFIDYTVSSFSQFGFENAFGGEYIIDGNIPGTATAGNPITVMGIGVIIFGAIVMIAGIVLAVVLKRLSKK